MQLNHPDYKAFLEFMCPDYDPNASFPPPGPDPSVCSKMILGTYDDHDYIWNDGNRLLPGKWTTREFFSGRDGGREIDVIMLDERWNRDPLPCETRRDYCNQQVAA